MTKKKEKEDDYQFPDTEMVTPAMATNWLENNKFSNRPISDRMVEKIARDIKNNKWIYDDNSIKFDEEDNVIDGQHRLWAVIKAQRTVRMRIVKGLRREAINTIDMGKPRSGGDVLHFHGYKNTIMLAASCRLSMSYKQSKKDLMAWARAHSGRMTFSAAEIIGEANTNPILVDSVNTVSSMRFVKKYVSVGTAAFCLAMFTKIDKIMADEFFYLLDKGIELPEGHPVLLLRNLLTMREYVFTKIWVKGTNYRTAYIVGLIIKAWNMYRDGKFGKRLTFVEDREEYPVAQ